jgi:hypothetical protein
VPSARDDYLLRMISQIAAAVARLRARLSGGATADELIPEIRSAERELLGPRGELLRAVDPATAAQLLGTSEAVRVWVDLLRLEAEVLRANGNVAGAEAIDRRATQLDRGSPSGAARPARS